MAMPMLRLGCAHGGAHCGTVCTQGDCIPFDVPLAWGQGLAHGPKACHCWHHWRRAGRRSRGDRPTANGSTMIGPIGLHSPKAPRNWESIRLAHRPPHPEGPTPMDHQWHCLGIVRTQFCSARPRARTQGRASASPMAKRTAQTARCRNGPRKANREAPRLSPGASAAGEITVRNGTPRRECRQ